MTDKRIHNRLLSSLLMGLMTINVVMAADTSRPKLVVGIVVDQLRSDYLQYLKDLFGDSGFKKLMDEGVFISQLDFRANVDDPVASTAILYTGNYPPANGIPAASVWSPTESKIVEALQDKSTLGNYTRETLSPAALRLSTISDEIAIDGDGLTSIYSVAPDPQQAIIMAGHAGSSALWINDFDGKWSSSVYYKDFPAIIGNRNSTKSLASRLDTLQWRPSMDISKYPGLPPQKKYYPFRHTFPRSDRDVYRRLKSAAPVNVEVTDAAIDLLKNLSLGKRGDAIDMLNVAYTAAPYKFVNDGDYRIELEDTYIRLDSQLGRLLKAIDSEVGLQNTLLFLSSTGYYNDATPDDAKFRIPSGDISLRRVESLLNSYLSAKYGNGDFIASIVGNQIFFDRRQLDTHSLSIEKAMAEGREFLVKMSGIADVRTLGDILSDPSEESARTRRSIDPKKSGDLFITFLPGWNVIDDIRYPASTTPIREGMTSAPFILLAPGVKPQTINTPVDAAAIAPTITSTLHIRSPNGASTRPLTF